MKPRLVGRDLVQHHVERDPETSCWIWRGQIDRRGYGKCGPTSAHQYAYRAYVGQIPEGLQIDHVCNNKRCVNPAHLEAVTAEENMRRRSALYTHCAHGHEFTPENTYRVPRTGTRACRTCNSRRAREYRHRRVVAA